MTLNNGFPPNNYQHAPSIQLNIHPDYNRYQTSNDSNMQQYPSITVVEQHGTIDPDSSRSTVGYMQLPFNKPIHFGYDEQGQIWYYIDDPRHPIPIADIVFLSVIDIVDPSNTVTPRRFVRYINKYGEFQQAFECSLLTKSTLYTIFSLDKVNEKLNKQLINDMLIFAMDRAKNHYRLEVSRYMGWHLTKDQHLLFYYREMIPPECVKECPSSVQKRRVVFPSQTSLDPPIGIVENLLSNPDFAFLILLRYASMLLYFFTLTQIKPECVFVISGIETSQRSLCSYILNNIDYSSFYLSNDKLLKGDYSEIRDINDGIALFNCNNENQKSFTRILKNAVDELRNAQYSIDAAQHLTILLSELQYSSQNNNVCYISLDAINDPYLSNIHQSLRSSFLNWIET